jgi:hypothetical protein
MFPQSSGRHGTTDHKRNEGIREDIGITGINTVMTNYQRKWLGHLETMPANAIRKLLYEYKLKVGRCQGRRTKICKEQF